MPSIAEATAECVQSFESLIQVNVSEVSDKINDNLTRFRIWAGNIGAWHDASSKKSADFRLRDGPEVAARILELLVEITLTNEELLSYLQEHGGEVSLPSDGDEISEADDLVLSVGDSITSLLKVSTFIRRATGRDRYARAAFLNEDPLPQQYADFDRRHVVEKFPKLRQQSWLAERLGNAITQRRRFLRYAQRHHERISRQPPSSDERCVTADEHGNVALNALSTTGPTLTGTVASTAASTLLPDRLEQLSSSNERFEDDEDNVSLTMSFVSSGTNDGDPYRADVVSLEKFAKPGAPFECPYCRGIVHFKYQRQWRKHVFRDLRAYTCTFKDCESGLFEDRSSWFNHELEHHRRVWTCLHCPKGTYLDVESFTKHLKTVHEDKYSNILPHMLQASSRPITEMLANGCPLCNEWYETLKSDAAKRQVSFKDQLVVSLTDFKQHLGSHHEQLALFAIASEAETTEDSQSRSDSDAEDDEQRQTGELLEWQQNVDGGSNPDTLTVGTGFHEGEEVTESDIEHFEESEEDTFSIKNESSNRDKAPAQMLQFWDSSPQIGDPSASDLRSVLSSGFDEKTGTLEAWLKTVTDYIHPKNLLQQLNSYNQRPSEAHKRLKDASVNAQEEIWKERRRCKAIFGRRFEIGDETAVEVLQQSCEWLDTNLLGPLQNTISSGLEPDVIPLIEAVEVGLDMIIGALHELQGRLEQNTSQQLQHHLGHLWEIDDRGELQQGLRFNQSIASPRNQPDPPMLNLISPTPPPLFPKASTANARAGLDPRGGEDTEYEHLIQTPRDDQRGMIHPGSTIPDHTQLNTNPFARMLYDGACRGDVKGVDSILQGDIGSLVDIEVALGDNGPVIFRTPLLGAIENSQHAVVKHLLNVGANVNPLMENVSEMPLHLACATGDQEIVRLLLEAGADPNAFDRNGERPLHTAIQHGTADLVPMLVALGGDPNGKGAPPFQYTPLYYAIAAERAEMVAVLLSAGADPNQGWRNPYGSPTPLHLAASMNLASVVITLLSYGADAQSCNVEGQSVLQAAELNGALDAARALRETMGWPELDASADFYARASDSSQSMEHGREGSYDDTAGITRGTAGKEFVEDETPLENTIARLSLDSTTRQWTRRFDSQTDTSYLLLTADGSHVYYYKGTGRAPSSPLDANTSRKYFCSDGSSINLSAEGWIEYNDGVGHKRTLSASDLRWHTDAGHGGWYGTAQKFSTSATLGQTSGQSIHARGEDVIAREQARVPIEPMETASSGMKEASMPVGSAMKKEIPHEQVDQSRPIRQFYGKHLNRAKLQKALERQFGKPKGFDFKIESKRGGLSWNTPGGEGLPDSVILACQK